MVRCRDDCIFKEREGTELKERSRKDACKARQERWREGATEERLKETVERKRIVGNTLREGGMRRKKETIKRKSRRGKKCKRGEKEGFEGGIEESIEKERVIGNSWREKRLLGTAGGRKGYCELL